MRILYVEDEKLLAEAVIHLLKKSDIAVDHVDNGDDGLEYAMSGSYDCMVLDIMLPGISGLEILKTIRARGITTPVIMLSALSQVDDKVKALEAGADDYMAKPFKTAELVARLNALNRRPPLQEEKINIFGDLIYDSDNRTINGVVLTAKEAEILELFLRWPDQTLSKQRLLAHVWGNDTSGMENYAEVYISYLRKKLREAGSKVEIKVIRGLGYKLKYDGVADV